MDPEKRLLVIVKYLSVEFLVLIVCTILGHLVPKRIGIVDGFGNLGFFLFFIFFALSLSFLCFF